MKCEKCAIIQMKSQWGYPDGMDHRRGGGWFSQGGGGGGAGTLGETILLRVSIPARYLHWDVIFVLSYRKTPQR